MLQNKLNHCIALTFLLYLICVSICIILKIETYKYVNALYHGSTITFYLYISYALVYIYLWTTKCNVCYIECIIYHLTVRMSIFSVTISKSEHNLIGSTCVIFIIIFLLFFFLWFSFIRFSVPFPSIFQSRIFFSIHYMSLLYLWNMLTITLRCLESFKNI